MAWRSGVLAGRMTKPAAARLSSFSCARCCGEAHAATARTTRRPDTKRHRPAPAARWFEALMNISLICWLTFIAQRATCGPAAQAVNFAAVWELIAGTARSGAGPDPLGLIRWAPARPRWMLTRPPG